MSTFYGGLEAAIGAPDPMINSAMEREHTHGPDAADTFTTSNYLVSTTPRIEWQFVAEPEQLAEWPVEQSVPPPPVPRSPLSKPQLLQALRRKNAELEAMRADQLLLEEVLAARL